MTSGKVAKRQRAAQAPPPVRGAARGRQASPRVLIAAVAIIAGLAAGAILAVVLVNGSSSNANVPSRGSLANGLPGAADVEGLLKGIPQSANVLGSPKAPVTLIEYIDLQCPYCRQFETEAMPTLIARYVRTGKLKVEARPIGYIGPDSESGRAAAIAAGEQNRLFNFAQLLYSNQGIENTGWLNTDMITSAAASIPGLDVPRLLTDRKSSAVADKAAVFDAQASTDGVKETPTILVGKTGATPKHVVLSSPSEVKPIEAAIAAALH
jgi:protein-disulfide isomerase